MAAAGLAVPGAGAAASPPTGAAPATPAAAAPAAPAQPPVVVAPRMSPEAQAAAAAAPRPSPADPRPELRRIAPDLLRRHRVPGLAVALVRGRRVVWTECFGVKRAGGDAAVGAGTVFAAGALSQPLLAWVVLREVAAGALALDKPLAGYLREPYVADPRGARITALEALDHSSGLPDLGGGQPKALAFDPGTSFRYSGAGYAYLQRVLEQIAGRPLEEILRQMALSPLGMAASGCTWRDEYARSAATPHDRDGAPLGTARPHAALGARAAQAAPAGSTLYTTAADYGRFLAAMLDPAAHQALLPPAATGSMLSARIQVDPRLGLAWGLGWGLETWQGSRWFFQWGANDGFRSFVLGNAMTGDGLVALTNGDGGLDLMDELVRVLDGNAHPLFGSPLLHLHPTG